MSHNHHNSLSEPPPIVPDDPSAVPEGRPDEPYPIATISRRPSPARYPATNRRFMVNHGINIPNDQLGFTARAIVGDNPTASWIYIDAMATWIPPQTKFAFNLPVGSEAIGFEWRTAPFTIGAVAPVAGQFAMVYIMDEWVPPLIFQWA